MRTRLPILLLGLAALAVTPTQADAAAVGLFGGAIQPRSITIAPGERVTWINGEASPREVRSDRGVWSAFSVAPGGTSRAVRFPRVGRFPYRVDGRLPGVVVVSRRLQPRRGGRGGTRRGAGGGPGAGTERVLRYRATINGETRSRTFAPGDPAAGGRRVTKQWRMVFADVRIVVRTFPGTPASAEAWARGAVDTSFRYTDDEKATPSDPRPLCDIGGRYPNMAATLSVSGNADRGSIAGSISVHADHGQGGLLEGLSRAAANFACPEREPGSPLNHGSDLGEILLRGTTLDGHANPPTSSLRRTWSSPALRPPLDDVLSGRRLIHYDTGLRTQLLVSNQPSSTPTCPDPSEPCSAEELSKRIEITLRRR